VFLTLDDARALAAESPMVAVASPELQMSGVRAKSAYNAASVGISGIEPQYQDIRTIELEYGRNFNWQDEEHASRVAIVGFDVAEQLFGHRYILGEVLTFNGIAYTVVGKIARRNRTATTADRQQQDLRAVCGHGEGHAAGTPSQRGVQHHRVAEGWVVADLPARSTRGRGGSKTSTGRSSRTSGPSCPPPWLRPGDRDAVAMWTRRCRR
jgi:hypothetical protein